MRTSPGRWTVYRAAWAAAPRLTALASGVSAGGEAAVDGQHRASDVGGVVRSEVDAGAGYLLHGAQALERLGADDAAVLVGRVAGGVQDAFQPGRVDRAGGDAVDADVAVGEVHRQRAGEGDHPALGGAVGRLPGDADQPGDGGGVNDGAAALGQHGAQAVLAAQEDTLEVHVQHVIPLVLVQVRDVAHLDHSGLVEQHVQ